MWHESRCHVIQVHVAKPNLPSKGIMFALQLMQPLC